MFSHLIGNKTAAKHLAQMAQGRALPPVLLFYGPEGVGKGLFALALAKMLIGSSKADLHVYTPDGNHAVQAMRQLIDEVGMPPFESPCKVFIVHDADKMLAPSSNALLKTLEEPPADTIIILTTSEPDKILPTILSRCRKVPFFPIAEEEIFTFLVEHKKVHPDLAKKSAFHSEGSLGRALALAERKERLPVEELLKAQSYPELLHVLSKIDDKAEEEAEKLAQADQLFEEILFYIREHHPFQLEKAVQLIADGRRAVQHHVKLKNVVEQVIFRIALNPGLR